MEIKDLTTDGTYSHLALIGKLDIVGVGEIENKFLGYTVARKKNTILDLSGVTFMGSMGLRIFLSAAKPMQLNGHKLILLNPSQMVKEVLEMSGISDIIPIATDEAAAVALAKA